MGRARRILMTMIEVGFGHKAPAMAVRDELLERYPGELTVDVVDFAKASGAYSVDANCKKSWDLALAFPASARIGYLLVEMMGTNHGYLDVFFKEFVEKGIAYIHDYQPDLVFATHPLCLYVAVKAREALNADFRIVAYVVDPFDGYAWWANEGADALLVATERSRERLLSKGMDPAKIRLMGFPLKAGFLDVQADTASLAASLGLDPGKPTILVSAGAQGIGKVYSYIELLVLQGLPLNIVTVAGKSARTKKRMDAIAGRNGKTTLVSLGFVRNMNELMNLADLVVGKAGASTAMEAIFLRKPAMFTEWAAYNDRYIINFVLDYGIGFYCPNFFSFSLALKDIALGDRLEKCRRQLEALNMRPGTAEVADYLYREAAAR